ncbi:MAG: STAS domain-containing protein [Planctomycetota bacterium]
MFERERIGTIDVIHGVDALVTEHLEPFVELLDECADEGQPKAVLDLRDVPLIDSAGLETLLDMQEKFEGYGGALKLLISNGLCKDILDVTGVDSHFEVFADVREAVGSFAE